MKDFTKLDAAIIARILGGFTRKNKYRTNDEIADRLVLLLSNADSASDEGEAVGRLHAVGRHVELHRDQIIAGLRKKANY